MQGENSLIWVMIQENRVVCNTELHVWNVRNWKEIGSCEGIFSFVKSR